MQLNSLPLEDRALGIIAAQRMLEPLTGRQLFIVWCRFYFGMGIRETARYQGLHLKTVQESMEGVKKKWTPYLPERRNT
jgi:hypothetical protein